MDRDGAPHPRLTGTVAALSVVAVVSGCGVLGETARAEWTLHRAPDGRQIHLRVGIGVPCNELAAVDVEERPDVVTIGATVRLARGVCDDMFTVEDVQVTLDEPLGDRRLEGCIAPVDGVAVRLDAPNPDCRRLDR